ncbi:MAG: MFS transporter [Oscillospiraceae bacterium]
MERQVKRLKRHTTSEWSWIMYDWANSVYATIIMAAVFPIYFSQAARAAGVNGDMWWGYGTSIATFTVAILAPVLGAIADYKGMKKRLFSVFLVIGIGFTLVMAINDNWKLMLLGYVLSYIGFSGSCLFYDSFLTDITTPERMDNISAKGYAMGYIGGSTIPFIVSILLIQFMSDSVLAVKLSVVLTSVWWAIFSIPFLRDVKQTHSLGEIPKNIVGAAFKNAVHTFKDILKNKAVFLFIIAYFFYIDGVNTVIHMSTSYGATLGLGSTGMILALLVTQVVAAPCAVLFSKLSAKIGSIKMIGISVAVYFVICATGFYMGYSLEPSQFSSESAYTQSFNAAVDGQNQDDPAIADVRANGLLNINSVERSKLFVEAVESSELDADTSRKLVDKVVPVLDKITSEGTYDYALKRSNYLFWVVAILVGTCQGGIQALSRSYFGKLIPPEKSNEYFGFFDIFGKFAAVMGPALYASIKGMTGHSSYGILSLMVLFILGGLVLFLGRNRFKEAELQNARPQSAE